MSNLSYISKLIEKAVAKQINEHIAHEGISNENQSAYRAFHSTETVLLKIQNDIATSMDKGAAVGLVLLDLSAAFDTTDHSILFNCLQHWYGIDGVVGPVIPPLMQAAHQNRWTSFRCFSTPLRGSPGLSSMATPFYPIHNPSQFSHI